MSEVAETFVKLGCGDCRELMGRIPEGSVRCVVTSPPYYGLRDYGVDGQIGLEGSPDEYVDAMVAVFREVRRVLADDGTVWLNIGDSYLNGKGMSGGSKKYANGEHSVDPKQSARRFGIRPVDRPIEGLKPKDLIGIPWRVAFALQADGWYLRSDIIWHKPNPMPESVKDRPTKAHEYLFLFSKQPKYYYDAESIKEPASPNKPWAASSNGGSKIAFRADGGVLGMAAGSSGRNRRTVWTITPKPYRGAHFAVMPPDLVEPCILAGSAPGDAVLDPFVGSGTVLAVAVQHGRSGYGIDLNPEYLTLAKERIGKALKQARQAHRDNRD